ncbi:putative cysteine desulfurase [Symbiodinium microadriaticum]|uniref:Putative cysteine desulfurase n=1 Tax=Symbiodinium microadriaticum TaxID=2951 RepID=A0A1Q9E3V9_SYMMI|nr:putative cysteine desulfurase [Symbiodinium microadriaticum]
MLRAKGVDLPVGSRAGFHEVVLRSPGRYDVPCDFEVFPKELLEKFECIANELLAETEISETQRRSRKVFAGTVRALPGSERQIWHADSPHVSSEHKGPHLLNVLVATRNLSKKMGPTELVPGSHVLTNHLHPKAQFSTELLYQRVGNCPDKIGAKQLPVAAEMDAGSVLIFDDRILHRGGENVSVENRDVVFFSYARLDFDPETHYEAFRSLNSYDHYKLSETVRKEFPGLRSGLRDAPVLADGASGSQLHESAIQAVQDQLTYGIANIGGAYESSSRAEAAVSTARLAASDFLGCDAQEVVFGASMTALVLHLARALGPALHASAATPRNVVLDPMSHGANVWPWLKLAAGLGAEVRWLPVLKDCLCLDTSDQALGTVIDRNTCFVAAGAASNGVGSIHDVQQLCQAAKELSEERALTFVDAVHFAPHGHVNVRRIGCDFLVCSPYKFFGPHAGILFGRRRLSESLPADRLDCSDDSLPSMANGHMSRWEVGTQNYEALAGVTAAVNYLADLGHRFGGASPSAPRPERLEAGWHAIEAHENDLKRRFLEGLQSIRTVHLLGEEDPTQIAHRTATFAVCKESLAPQELAKRLCSRGIWCTAGNHYAGFWEAHSGGLATNEEGMARLGLLHYNSVGEVDRILAALEDA